MNFVGADRTQGISGSVIAAILGLNPPGWMDRMGAFLHLTGQAEEKPQTAAMQRGIEFEGFVLSKFAERMGVPLVELIRGYDGYKTIGELIEHTEFLSKAVVCNRVPCADTYAQITLRHPDFEWWMGTPDAFYREESAIVEAKTTTGRLAHLWGEDGSDEIPEHYFAQCMWNIGVTGASKCYVPVLFSGYELEFRVYVINRDESLLESLRAAGEKFMADHIVPWKLGDRDCAPEVTGSDDSAAFLNKRYPRSSDQYIQADEIAVELAQKLADAVSRKKSAEADEELVKNQLKAAIGMNKGIIGSNFKITWSQQQRKDVDWKKLAADLNIPADKIEQYTNISSFPRLNKSGQLFKD